MTTISVIFTTYNSLDWLEKVIWGFSCQTLQPDEIIIADDGSTDETRVRIDQLRTATKLNIIHVWHEDEGFRKTLILNKAIVASTGDYLIFTDGDCVPRNDFVATHMHYAESGYLLSGGYFKLPMQASSAISKGDVLSGSCFDVDWLKKHGLQKTYKTVKLSARGWQKRLFNAMTPTGATWNGHNASGWRSDIIATNGFDTRMQYGGEDRELGERMFNMGIKAKQIRYSAVCIHLDHARSYITQDALDKNRTIRDATHKNKSTRTEFGIAELEASPSTETCNPN
jgi:glycosyltransferase involved in cell wall biosynthesis